tara:strand:- start:98 stop:523 length:426 start_codon:yes stop_codon:yes gene_type:complete
MTLRGVEKKRNPYKDPHSGLNILEIVADNGEKRFYDSGIEMRSTALTRFSVGDSDPLSAKAEYEWVREFSRENWQTKTKTNTTITSDLKYFYLKAESIAQKSGVEIFRQQWDRKYLRDHFWSRGRQIVFLVHMLVHNQINK